MTHSISRRQAIAIATAAAVGATLATVRAAPAEAPAQDVGRKLNADGTVHAFAGNTFIGHVPQQGEGFDAFDALLNIYRDAPAHRFARKLMLLPPSSYHVTVFGGLNEVDRGTREWPSAMPADRSLPAVTRAWLDTLRDRPPLAPAGFDFTPGEVRRLTDGAPHIPLRPADADTAQRLAALRDALAQLTGIRRADHDSYGYHLTFGYLRQRLLPAEADELLRATVGWKAALPQRLHIPAVQFCSFRDMFAFQVLHTL